MTCVENRKYCKHVDILIDNENNLWVEPDSDFVGTVYVELKAVNRYGDEDKSRFKVTVVDDTPTICNNCLCSLDQFTSRVKLNQCRLG